MTPNRHLNNEEFIGLIYKTLDDFQREGFESHLSECSFCQAKLNAHKQLQNQIGREIKNEINAVSPPLNMNFAEISPKLKRRPKIWLRLSTTAPLAAATLGLLLTLIGAWQSLIDFSQTKTGTPLSAPLPTLAGFFFMFISMDQFDRSITIRPRLIFAIILSVILWLGSCILGLLNIIVIRDLTIAATLFAGGNPKGASVIAILTVILAAMIMIGVIIGGAEYHYKHIGQPSSWKLFVWTLAIQLLIMVLPYFVL